eukprot:Hpha_TRINITY_DN16237_c1_g2::TRINITY_DN16237_c1_g2_i1::g.16477::m.16477
MSIEWDESSVEALVYGSVSAALISLPQDSETDIACLQESIVAEILDWSPEAEAPSAEHVSERMGTSGVTDMIESLGVPVDEVADLWEKLCAGVAELLEDEDEGEDLQDGECELCERELPLTLHHVIPKTTHDYYLSGAGRKFGFTKEECFKTIPICRPCHNAVHRVRDHRQLAETARTRETLMEVPELAKFVGWVRKKKVTARPDKHRNHCR